MAARLLLVSVIDIWVVSIWTGVQLKFYIAHALLRLHTNGNKHFLLSKHIVQVFGNS